MLSDEIQKVEIDEQRLSQMKNAIIDLEKENIKTGKFKIGRASCRERV